MNTRNQIVGTYIVKISIAVLILLVCAFLYFRLDLSRDKGYSLSAQSKETVSKLKDNIIVKIYASRNLPSQYGSALRALKDLLEEYERLSRHKLRYEFVPSENDEDLAKKAAPQNIQATPYQSGDASSTEIKLVILGITMEVLGKTSTMNLFPGIENKLEYQLTKMIGGLDGQNLPEILVYADSIFVENLRKLNPNGLRGFQYELLGNFKAEITDLESMPKQAPAMLFMGVTDSLSTRQLYHLDQYLMRGGKIVMAQDRVRMLNTSEGEMYLLNESNLFEMLAFHGIALRPNIVLDRKCAYGPGSGLGSELPYYYVPMVRGSDSKPYTRGFNEVLLLLASQISHLPGNKLKYEPVMQTSANSNVMLGPVFDLNRSVERGFDPATLNMPPLTVAAEFSGEMKSYFSPESELARADSLYQGSNEQGQIILFADSELPLDFNAGAFITMNAVDYLLGRDKMIDLRSRNPQMSYLGTEMYLIKNKIDLADPQPMLKTLKTVFQLTALLLPTLFLILAGVAQAFRTRKLKQLRLETLKREMTPDEKQPE